MTAGAVVQPRPMSALGHRINRTSRAIVLCNTAPSRLPEHVATLPRPTSHCHVHNHDRPSEISELRGPACHRASRLSRRTAGRSRLPAGRLVVAGDAWRPTAGWHTPGCQAHDRCAGAAAGCSASELPATRRRTARMTAQTPFPSHPAHRIPPRALRLALHVRQFQGILRLQPAFQRRPARRCVYRYFGRSPRPLGISLGLG